MKTNTFLLYGAYGYTGEIIARMAKSYGLQPILAGRNKEALEQLSQQTGFPIACFDLKNTDALHAALKEVEVVLHVAGPFKFTAQPMMEACLKTQTHYLDITGEIEVFEMANSYNRAAQEARIMIMSGTGFDVVPTDCMAKFLKDQLPEATHLELAFASVNAGPSQGTALTMVEGLGEGGAIRENGKIVKVPLGHKGKKIAFTRNEELFAMTIPWGDVSTAYYTTGIPNIETYMQTSRKTYDALRYQKWYNWLLRMPFVRKMAENKVKAGKKGPSEMRREKSSSYVWGKATTASGKSVSARIATANGYTLTATTALIITKRVLNGDFKEGFQTPASAYGADLVMEVEGTTREIIF